MSLAYVDTSCLVAIAFGEPEAYRTAARLRRFDRLLSSNLLEAELRSSLKREGVGGHPLHLLSWLTWIYPDRPLTAEFERVTSLGYLKGADLWHVANALFVAPDAHDLAFVTLDARQKEVATRLGFTT
jgi:predicted nucleic acid-binding protein